MRRHQVHLKLAVRRNLALPLEVGEHGVRLQGNIRVEQVLEFDVSRRDTGLEPVAPVLARKARMQLKGLSRRLERRMSGKDRLQPGDPVAALAGFSIRDRAQSRAQGRADGLEHSAGIRQRDAADQMHIANCHGMLTWHAQLGCILTRSVAATDYGSCM